MQDVENAIMDHPEGSVINILLTPNAKKNHLFFSYNPWRNVLECQIHAPPVEGKANRELIIQCAEWFNIPQTSVRILTGFRSNQKKVLIEGKSREEVLAMFRKTSGNH
jgi:uncharacterized protein (TIGR00251 family)